MAASAKDAKKNCMMRPGFLTHLDVLGILGVFALNGIALPGLLATAQDPLRYSFAGRRGQVEVGGPFAAAEFHDSRPVPSRIGFFHPVANSVDLSTDYWKRGESIPLSIRIDAGSFSNVLARESWEYDLSPFGVTFRKNEGTIRMSVSYAFGERLPAMFVTTTVVNAGEDTLPVDIVTHLLFALRTCQSYTRLDSSTVDVEGPGKMVTASFSERGAHQAVTFVRNLGASPVAWSTDADAAGIKDNGEHAWSGVRDTVLFMDGRRRNAALFRYRADLRPGDSVVVVHMIGSTEAVTMPEISRNADMQWASDIALFEGRVRHPANQPFEFTTGDRWIDRTAAWSRSLVEANQHVLDGSLVPMPCPAEYNFLFTHDILLSGLGIVNVDGERVRRDLQWIVKHADGTNIPHAYYWRDSSFQTEYCTPSNWNHLWFLMLSARYIRYTHDTATGLTLLPYAERSVRDLLTQVGADDLVHAPRPDWWDIGWRDGPRAYLTALMSRALDEYVVFRTSIGRRGDSLQWLENTSIRLRTALLKRLWNERSGYLLDRNGNDIDRHIFAGPLIAAVYRLLPQAVLERLVRTAEGKLLAPGVGIRAVMPANFDRDSVKRYYDIKGNEAGNTYWYINGGVWPHLNAWYAVALHQVGRTQDAIDFFRTTMTLDGVASGPSGIPAMYEYRMSDVSSKDFGTVDKPSFLWVGGFNLFTMYQLAGIRDVPWNLAFDPSVAAWPTVIASWNYGGKNILTVRPGKNELSGIMCDGVRVPSYVLPLEYLGSQTIDVIQNGIPTPVLSEINAVVHRVWKNEAFKTLNIECSSFEGRTVEAFLLTPKAVGAVTLDGKKLKAERKGSSRNEMQRWSVKFPGSSRTQRLKITL